MQTIENKKGPLTRKEMMVESFRLGAIVYAAFFIVSVAANPFAWGPFWGPASRTPIMLIMALVFAGIAEIVRRRPDSGKNSERVAVDIWTQLTRRELSMLALAVFLMFATIGPVTLFMNTPFRHISVLRVLVSSFFAGSLSASIILFGRRKVILFICLVITIAGISAQGEITSFLSGAEPEQIVARGVVTLTEAERESLEMQRINLGVFTIMLIAAGYVTFIYVIGRQGHKRVKLQTEIQMAKKIQDTLNLQGKISKDWVAVEAITVTADEVGGDYVDCFELNEHEVVIVVGDASGHGVGAGIHSAMAKSVLKCLLDQKLAVPEVLRQLNRTIFNLLTRDKYLTMALARIDRQANVIEIATAGHHPVFMQHAGVIEEIRTPSLGLGLYQNAAYTTVLKSYLPGDRLFFFTDGIVEAVNEEGSMFGPERVKELFAASAAGAESCCSLIADQLTRFRGKKKLTDDVSLTEVRLKA
ncbi:MAG: serine/threonine-protein phosphatase [Ignavibacteria bacterium]|nr:serine/threonine-protein phosphatase [Ignavibacteria bacterium]